MHMVYTPLMEPVLRAAVRAFAADEHLIDVLVANDEWLDLYDESGAQLPGIRGRAGAVGLSAHGEEIGVDLIEMDPGSAFPLHVHPGDHVLFGLEGEGFVTVNETDHRLGEGVTVFIAAEQPHGVRGPVSGRFRFLAFGVPHKHVSSTSRMRLVDAEHSNLSASPEP